MGCSFSAHLVDLVHSFTCCLQVGTPSPDSKAVIWVICRQHPGEPMAEWFAEGLLERLTAAAADSQVQQLLGSAVLYIVPNMNPDGSVRYGDAPTVKQGCQCHAVSFSQPRMHHVLMSLEWITQ